MTVDVGTGDGRAPLHVARARADTFAIGIEPSLDALRETARALVRRPLPNVALLVSSLDEAVALGPIADELTVTFPWGSLLDAVVGARGALTSLAAIARPGAALRVLVSLTERERRPVPPEAELVRAYRWAGLDIVRTRPATVDDVAAAHSTWGKRLGAGRARPATLIEAVRLPDGRPPVG